MKAIIVGPERGVRSLDSSKGYPMSLLQDPKGRRLIGPTLNVNSYHDQGITRDQVASPLEVFALSEDDIVEGAYNPDLPILGIMWHPERPHKAADQTNKLIEWWLSF
jgi:putative glutamine amidotransferase